MPLRIVSSFRGFPPKYKTEEANINICDQHSESELREKLYEARSKSFPSLGGHLTPQTIFRELTVP